MKYTSDIISSDERLHIAILDTGINFSPIICGFHPCFYDAVADSDTNADADWHGTNVAVILCSILNDVKDNIDISYIKIAENGKNLEFPNLKNAYDLFKFEPKLQDVSLINQSCGLCKTPDEKYDLKDIITDKKVLICSVSNEGRWSNYNIAWPAKEAVAVGSHDENVERSEFSPQGRDLWVLAPGEYGELKGTSYAAPWVTALLAHFLLQLPHRYPGNIRFQY